MSKPFYQRPLVTVIFSDGSFAIASRLYVYIAGFAAVFLLSANIPAAQFGEYSLYQAGLELGVIVATLGSALVFSRNAALDPPAVGGGDLRRTLFIGIPVAALLLAAMLSAQGLLPFSQSGVWLLLSLGFFSFNGLRLAYRRGRGQAGLLNIESGIRATVFVACILLFLWHRMTPSVEQLLLVNLAACVLITLTILTGDKQLAGPPPGAPLLSLKTQWAATAYSLMSFALRKADLLLVAFFMPLDYLGAFKIAFLLAEAPSQFVLAYLYTHTSSMISVGTRGYGKAKIMLARNCFLLGLALFAGLCLMLHVFGPLLKFGREAQSIFLCMLPYFLVRTYTVHHEMLIQLNTRLQSLGFWSFGEVVVKLCYYLLVAWAFPETPHYAFFIMASCEIISYEFRAKKILGHFPIVLILHASRGKRA